MPFTSINLSKRSWRIGDKRGELEQHWKKSQKQNKITALEKQGGMIAFLRVCFIFSSVILQINRVKLYRQGYGIEFVKIKRNVPSPTRSPRVSSSHWISNSAISSRAISDLALSVPVDLSEIRSAS